MTSLLNDLRFRLGSCVIALVVVAVVGAVVSPPAAKEQAAARMEKVVVGRSALACPVMGPANGSSSGVDVAAPALPPGTPTATGDAKPLELHRLGPKTGTLVAKLTERSRMVSAPPAKPEPMTVRGTGPLAAGATATVTTTASTGVNKGMGSTACIAPSAEFWFAGASSAAGRRDVLVLTNLDDANSSVDVTLYGASGVLDTSAGKGIVVRGRHQTEVFLSTVAPGQRELALRVVSTGGRVAAALRDNVSSGELPAGLDWLPPSAPPAREVTVPAIAPGAGARVLTIANPGELQTTATITVHGAGGGFKPAGRETVDIPPGGVRTVRLDEAIRGEAAAISVRSEEPVLASARIADAKNADFAGLGSTVPLTGPAYVALPPHADPATVIVSAAGPTGSAGLELRDPAGKVLLRRDVNVAEGSTVAVPLPAVAHATQLTVIPRRNGALVAGVTLTPPAKPKDDAVTRVAAWPLTTSLVFRAQLGARPDTRAALR